MNKDGGGVYIGVSVQFVTVLGRKNVTNVLYTHNCVVVTVQKLCTFLSRFWEDKTILF